MLDKFFDFKYSSKVNNEFVSFYFKDKESAQTC